MELFSKVLVAMFLRHGRYRPFPRSYLGPIRSAAY